MKISLLSFVFLLLIGCSDFEEFDGIKIKQYATKVIRFSSQYSKTSWSATRALGKENVYPNYGDNTNAWASLTADSKREYICPILFLDTASGLIIESVCSIAISGLQRINVR